MGGVKKEYCLLPGSNTTVLGKAVSAFSAFPCISRIVITLPEDLFREESSQRRGDAESAGEIKDEHLEIRNNLFVRNYNVIESDALSDNNSASSAISASLRDKMAAYLSPELIKDERVCFIPGGSTRSASVRNALRRLSEYKPGYVLIHDGCRPWVSAGLIQRIIDAVQQYQAVIPLLPMIDTPKEINLPLNADTVPFVTRHLRRSAAGLAQTPQAFAFDRLAAAYDKACGDYTDDAEVWGEFCGPVAVVPGEAENRKITFPEDLEA